MKNNSVANAPHEGQRVLNLRRMPSQRNSEQDLDNFKQRAASPDINIGYPGQENGFVNNGPLNIGQLATSPLTQQP